MTLRWRGARRAAPTAGFPPEAQPGESDGAVLWSGQLGRRRATLRQVDGRRVLVIGDRRIIVRPEAAVRHRGGLLGQRLVIEQPGEATFTYRYRLPWALQLAPLWEATYDRWSAEADDPGLDLTELLGGTDDWLDAPVDH
ncbi:hypothetical protein STRCI_000140 [Streptomyces cinnabarinus]|uniref:Uncharacterized protein n=1 Tax=Streptomyces cinnabarinus TaxID=67287 RepID=A0ABY7K3R4_9ACTN|nr:hypothetical protein [Streptomyces cinnabarinus]WAZ19112.1 hypothetical protein STRCI_000140 [Streptomyces cinnabarinus]